MKNKFMKKTLAAALALTLVGGGLPTAIGGKNIFENAIVADAADVGDILNFGDYLDGYYKNYDGSTIYIIGQEDDLNTIVKISEIDWENSRIHIQEFVNHLNQELWVNIPADRMYEYPTGIKIVSGEGTEESPYELELVYEGEPIVGYDTTVGVGTKWMIGDLINTNAYFSVPVKVFLNDTRLSNVIEYRTLQLYKKALSSPVQMKYNITSETDYTLLPAWGFENITLGCNARQTQEGHMWTDDIVFTGDATCVKGIEVTGGSGTEADPFTIAPIKNDKLADGKYTQTATKDGKSYTRFVFVKPKSELEGKSKAVFSATLNGKTKTFETSTYYTGMTSNGEYFTPASEDSVMFIVTVSSEKSFANDVPLDGLTCTLDFE